MAKPSPLLLETLLVSSAEVVLAVPVSVEVFSQGWAGEVTRQQEVRLRPPSCLVSSSVAAYVVSDELGAARSILT